MMTSSSYDDREERRLEALDRYELLYEAGLVQEAVRDGRAKPNRLAGLTGRPMRFDRP